MPVAKHAIGEQDQEREGYGERPGIKAYRKGTLAEVDDKHQRQLSETELELSQSRRELARVKMERDILKNRPKGVCLSPQLKFLRKAAECFARKSQEDTR